MRERDMSQVHGFMCGPRLYEYDGWFFEFSHYNGPWPLKKDGKLMKRAGKEFFKMFSKFDKLKNKEKYRVGGGCRSF